jgi:hypothetical protein
MSWSFQGVGVPAKVAEALDTALKGYDYPGQLTPSQSKQEFEAAVPALKALTAAVPADYVVSVNAYGHRSSPGTVPENGNIDVTIKTLGKML